VLYPAIFYASTAAGLNADASIYGRTLRSLDVSSQLVYARHMPNRNSHDSTPESLPYSLERPRHEHHVSENIVPYFVEGPTVLPASNADVGVRRASLFRNGRNQAVRIPREFELPPGEVHMYKEGNRIIIEPIARESDLAALFASWEALTDDFPDADVGLQPLNDVVL
jgi:antitoxin VapB